MDPTPTIAGLIGQAERLLGWPTWVFSLLLMALALAAALVTHEIIVRLVRRAMRRADEFWRPMVIRTRRPGRLALLIAALAASSAIAPLPPELAGGLRHLLLIAFIVLLGWTAYIALDIATALYMRRFKVDVDDNLLARKHLTQVRILRRALIILIFIVTASLALMTVSGVRQWGVSLLAAGGAASIIVGLALQPLLSNLIAGIQIAMTQPIRIDDAVVVEGEWGNVEEITATYVVIRVWDQRRLVLPLSYFLQNPFQNWTRESSELLGVVLLHVDYAAPVAAIRARLEEIARASPLWDGRVVVLQVTDLRERTMELRCLVSARNSGQAFDLRCEVREKLVAFLKEQHPEALPLGRLELRAAEAPAADARSFAPREPRQGVRGRA
ncbi:MAG: mechanosensitive ion channel domain-containing protein [Phenylobacterium sp.]|uniref:mechanosensitive ion channel family protein n=1 Tax=Phenylobacterium sp. TaxID=1871053 RepID=UPI002A2F73B7|nr:mechanosensitive ion channel domain-containing protein [Phenylobacterium sp.]MDD3836910.1 mechanosensitive ion channel [Phenylobacterium sp.]MDX9998456.1 mechanosensitive ion channel [Phenylobacterium sp.]